MTNDDQCEALSSLVIMCFPSVLDVFYSKSVKPKTPKFSPTVGVISLSPRFPIALQYTGVQLFNRHYTFTARAWMQIILRRTYYLLISRSLHHLRPAVGNLELRSPQVAAGDSHFNFFESFKVFISRYLT